MRIVLFLLILAACTHQSTEVAHLSAKKQKQKIAALEKKLKLAEKNAIQIAKDVEELQEQIRFAELALIRKNMEKRNSLFLEEREVLHRMIQSGPTPASLEAQIVLDEILQLITKTRENDTFERS